MRHNTLITSQSFPGCPGPTSTVPNVTNMHTIADRVWPHILCILLRTRLEWMLVLMSLKCVFLEEVKNKQNFKPGNVWFSVWAGKKYKCTHSSHSVKETIKNPTTGLSFQETVMEGKHILWGNTIYLHSEAAAESSKRPVQLCWNVWCRSRTPSYAQCSEKRR